MSETKTHPLSFSCINEKCGKESTYDNYLKKGKGPDVVIKKCKICGKDNKLKIPENWQPTEDPNTIIRGLNPD